MRSATELTVCHDCDKFKGCRRYVVKWDYGSHASKGRIGLSDFRVIHLCEECAMMKKLREA
jgi:hypothetical protein